MQELFLVASESTKSSLVLRTEDDQQFFLEVTDELRTALTQYDPHPVAAPASSSELQYGSKDEQEPEKQLASNGDIDSFAFSDTPIGDSIMAASGFTETTNQEESTTDTTARTSREVDSRLSAPLKMTPREIQEKIRGGATVEFIAEENDVPLSRIEGYAHPVLLERARLAELAKRAHPVRNDGPAQLTLWEILATAFAARGIDLTTAAWDAYRDTSHQWVVTVTWAAGVAEWSYHRQGTSGPTVVARNGLAADLIDPDYVPPVRNLTAVTTPIPVITEEMQREAAAETQEAKGEEVQQEQPRPPVTRRRRKAVTPHWEDVLLGVRTNSKRPRK